MNGVVVWVTGMPSSGKSTLGCALAERLRARGTPACVLDGDAVRAALVPAPGYCEDGRRDFYRTLANLAALLARQGLVVLVPATAHRSEYRRRARELAPRFIEVFVDVDADEVRRRDAKGLYAAARSGKAAGVPGADVAYERPEAPDLVARGGKDASALDRLEELLSAS